LSFDFKCYICDGFLTERGNKGCNSWGCRVHVKAAFVSAQQDEPQVGAWHRLSNPDWRETTCWLPFTGRTDARTRFSVFYQQPSSITFVILR